MTEPRSTLDLSEAARDTTDYGAANEAKASFDSVYTAPTPHAYIESMRELDYEIGERARPYCTAAADLLKLLNPDAWQVAMLDVGCSYGIGSAFVRYGCSFDEITSFFSTRAPDDYSRCVDATRMWLNVTPPACDVRCVGLDSSGPAIRFAVDAGLLDGGLARDYERPGERAGEEEIAWFRSCNLLMSTGAIGYITERTLDIVLPELGRDHPGDAGPFAVTTVLRMFDVEPIRACFERHDFAFSRVAGARLPQRRFRDREEAEQVGNLLRERGLDTPGWDEQGRMYADLFVAARPDQVGELLVAMSGVGR